jgi:hypothetical protein
MFGIKIEISQGFSLQYLERLFVIFEVLEKKPREQRVHSRRFHFTPRAFRKSMNLGARDMKIRYWTENYTLECFVRKFLLFLSVSKDPASGLPGSLLSDEYLEFGDVT